MRLRWTGARRPGATGGALNAGGYLPRRAQRKGVYGGLVVLFVLAGMILQSLWMRQVREEEAADIIPQSFAEKLNRWMLQKKGLAPEPAAGEARGLEKIDCNACMGTGTALAGDGRKDMCPICQGVGFRMVRRFDPADRICPACGGMGRMEMPGTGAVDTCPRCAGRGLILSRPAPAGAPDGN